MDNEKIVTLSDDPKFNQLYAERVRVEKEIQKRKLKTKLIVFFSILIFYIIFINSYWNELTNLLFLANGRIGRFSHTILVFILAAVFIWAPNNHLRTMGDYEGNSALGVGSNRIDKKTSVEALRLCGWLIYLTPGFFMILYLLGLVFAK